MSAERLLTLLEKVRCTRQGHWVACCSAHDDSTPSLAIRELDDGRVLLHCFAGCTVHEVVSSVGLELADLFPPRRIDEGKGKFERRPFPAADILRCIAFEALVVAMAAKSLLAGSLSEVDRTRLMLVVTRIHQAMDAGGISDVK